MKNVPIIIFSLFTLTFNADSQPLDSASVKKMIDSGIANVKNDIAKAGAVKKDATATPLQTTPPATTLSTPMVNLLTLLPVIFYLITLLMVSRKLTGEGAKLSWFLLDKELIAQLGKQAAQITTARLNAIAKAPSAEIAALAASATNHATQANGAENDNPLPPEENKESISRLIALLTGLVTLGIASCLTSFCIYKSFTGHADVDLGKLATVLYGLGLGLVPYGFTKVAGVLRS